jgi:hypothetical protein
MGEKKLTLDLGHSPSQNIFLSPFLRDVLQHVINDRLDEVSLLILFFLLFEPYPTIEHRLDLSGERDALPPHKRIRLELRSLLYRDEKCPQGVSMVSATRAEMDRRTLEMVKRPSVSETTSFI